MEGLCDGTLDAGILRDGDPMEGMRVRTIYRERFVGVVPAGHRLTGRLAISPDELRGEGFVYYPRSAGGRAYEKPLTIFEEHGFRPQIVQEASHWLTILRLVGAGMGVTVAPACVAGIAGEEVTFVELDGTTAESLLELAVPDGETRPIVRRFAEIAAGAGFEE